MQSTDKQETRRFFTEFLMSNSVSCPLYIQKKIAKVYVNIGRLDWPQFFPDFYHNILQVNYEYLMYILWILFTLFDNKFLALSTEFEEMPYWCRHCIPPDELLLFANETLGVSTINVLPYYQVTVFPSGVVDGSQGLNPLAVN